MNLSTSATHDLASVTKDMREFVSGNVTKLGLSIDRSMRTTLLRMDIFVQPASTPGLYFIAGYTLYQAPPRESWAPHAVDLYGPVSTQALSWIPIRYRQQESDGLFDDFCIPLARVLNLPPESNILDTLIHEAQVANTYPRDLRNPMLCYQIVRPLAASKAPVWLRCEVAVLNLDSRRLVSTTGLSLNDDVLEAYQNQLF